MGGWEGNGVGVGDGWEAEGGSTIHWHRERAAVSLVKHKNSHSDTPQWTVMDLHGQINAACESRPGHPQPCHWSVWIVLECGFHVI